MWWFADAKPDLANNPLLKLLRSQMKITDELQGEQFFVWRDGARYATLLFLALILMEISDLIFAVDSIPAIFAITGDPFIVLTSNVLAILGLRAITSCLPTWPTASRSPWSPPSSASRSGSRYARKTASEPASNE